MDFSYIFLKHVVMLFPRLFSGGGYIVSLKDMLNVTNPGQNINLKGSYRQWADIPRDYNGVITLYQYVCRLTFIYEILSRYSIYSLCRL